ncbi:MAG TPA: hypothetical protein VN893_14195 [Bryobacteraceae bacterium]|nr:hypothetical protein [Bryobacteraceae bacterium]
MALEAAFRGLSSQLRKLNDMLLALRLTVAEDKPVRGEAALVDHLEETILDLMGDLDGCMNSAGEAQTAVGHPVDLERARRALATCQERFHRVEATYTEELASYEKLKDLARLAHERRGEWIPWAGSVKTGIEQCRVPLEGSRKTLADCWLEMAERSGNTSISVRTSNVGQKIVTRSAADRTVAEGLT